MEAEPRLGGASAASPVEQKSVLAAHARAIELGLLVKTGDAGMIQQQLAEMRSILQAGQDALLS